MPYEGFDQNKKIKALDSAMAALDEAVRGLGMMGGGRDLKTLERYNYALTFLDRSRKSGAFSTEELATLEKGSRLNGGLRNLPTPTSVPRGARRD